MVPIYALSIASAAVFLHKWMQYRAARMTDMAWLEPVLAALRDGDVPAARACCRRAGHPAARAILAALDVSEHRADRIESEAARVASLELQRLERHLGALSFIAQVAPLLGLFGTVIGMVDLFLDLESSPGAALDITHISSGIWTALLTTAAGLLVAVPTLAGHTWLASRADRLRLGMHDAIEQMLTALVVPAGEAALAVPDRTEGGRAGGAS